MVGGPLRCWSFDNSAASSVELRQRTGAEKYSKLYFSAEVDGARGSEQRPKGVVNELDGRAASKRDAMPARWLRLFQLAGGARSASTVPVRWPTQSPQASSLHPAGSHRMCPADRPSGVRWHWRVGAAASNIALWLQPRQVNCTPCPAGSHKSGASPPRICGLKPVRARSLSPVLFLLCWSW